LIFNVLFFLYTLFHHIFHQYSVFRNLCFHIHDLYV
jgi:hypothetical protein